MNSSDIYLNYKTTISNEQYPLLILDAKLFQKNLKDIANKLKDIDSSKTIRIASKSVRSISLLKQILDYDPIFQGILSYSAKEAIFLSDKGFNDILIAYPTVNQQELKLVCEKLNSGADITLMVDNSTHLNKLNEIALKNDSTIPICIDIDMSTKYGLIHFGVFRSPIKKPSDIKELADNLVKCKKLQLKGVMGYEAQIAGVPDRSPSKNFLVNFLIRFMKKKSVSTIRKRRNELVLELKNQGFELKFVNGGGTGSVESTGEESIVTEVTVGSGFFSSHLFDYYDNFKYAPSMMYALEITRIPKKGIYTCHGGGYVASGSLGIDKIPKPYLPKGVMLIKNEMAGEVQTPIKYQKNEVKLEIGDPIFMRHSHAGEICEHFNEIVIISQGKIIERVKTYRGEGQIFL